MNLKELINSTKKTRSYYFDTHKDYRDKEIGSIINVDTSEYVDVNHGIIHMVMYLTAVTQKYAPITLYDKDDRRRKLNISSSEDNRVRRTISTHTVGISFKTEMTVLKLSDILPGFVERELDSSSKWTDEYSSSFFDLAGLQNMGKTQFNRFLEDLRGQGDPIDSLRASKIWSQKINPLMVQFTQKYPNSTTKQREEEASKIFEDMFLEDQVNDYVRHNKELYDRFPNGCQLVYDEDRHVKISSILDGDDYQVTVMNRLTLDTPVRVRCTCAHYFYTYAWYNADHQALIGQRPPAYTRVESGWLKKVHSKDNNSKTTRNLNQVPGLCKHLLFFINYLSQNNIINITQGTSKVGNSILSDKSRQQVKDVINNYGKGITKNKSFETNVRTAQDEAKEYLRDMGQASRQNKLFGPRKGGK